MPRRAFAEAQPSLDPAALVFVDEAGVNRKMTRRYARTHRSRRAVGHAPAGWGKNTTLTGAMSASGMLVLSRRVGGGTTTVSFLAFVRDELCPVLTSGQTVVLDSLSAHKASEAREAIEAAGTGVLYLPRYGPEHNPIALCWAAVQRVLRGGAVARDGWAVERWVGHHGFRLTTKRDRHQEWPGYTFWVMPWHPLGMVDRAEGRMSGL